MAFTITATDPDMPVNTFVFTLDPGFPDGAALDPGTGLFTWTPSENQGGQAFTVTVRVTDNGTPASSATKTFVITVNEVNNPPGVTQLGAQSVDEGKPFSIAVPATDPEGGPLFYSLGGVPPDGLVIDPTTGVITWTPAESQGPGSYPLIVRATEKGGGGLQGQMTFGITVNEVNQAPVLGALGDLTVEEGTVVTFQAVATDSDRPAQTLTYSLLPGAPTGAAIDPNTGVFQWATADDTGRQTNTVSVNVADNGPGNLSATQSFTIVTTPKLRVVIHELMAKPAVTGGEFVELANTSATTTWDIAGWRLVGRGLNFTFPIGAELAPGAFVCVAADAAKFRAAYGNAVPLVGAWTGVLSADEDLQLLRPGNPEVVVDRVAFRGTAPWPAPANGGGAALQLVDARRDNSRVANWSAAASYHGPRQLVVLTNQWRYWQSGPLAAAWKEKSFNDDAWPQGRGLLYVEGADLPAPKSTPLTLGQNTYYFRATFVLPSLPSGASLALSDILDDGAVFYLNGQEFHRQGIAPGPVDFTTPGFNYLNPGSAVGDAALAGPFTLPATALLVGTNVLAVEVHQVTSGSSDIVFGCALELVGGDVPGLTPGKLNNVAATLPEFPPLWLNEVLPDNAAGIVDSQGEREPWLELVNRGGQPVSLDGWSLAATYTNLTGWPFPAGTVIQPGQFLVVFADGEPGDATATELHTSFRLNRTNGVLALSRPQLGQFAVVDYLDYDVSTAGRSFGRAPEDFPVATKVFVNATPGAENVSGPPNQAPALAALAAATVAEGSVLSFTAAATDPDAGQTLRFTLVNAPNGAAISPAGAFTWTPSEAQGPGRYPMTVRGTDDGVPVLSAERTFTVTVTEVNQPPTVAPVADATVMEGQKLSFAVLASDLDLPKQKFAFALRRADGVPLPLTGPQIDSDSGVLSWSPGAADGPSTNRYEVEVSDNGVPSLSAVSAAFRIIVLESNLPPVLAPVLAAAVAADGTLTMAWPSVAGTRYRVEFRDTLAGPWQMLREFTATGADATATDATSGRRERYYRLVLP